MGQTIHNMLKSAMGLTYLSTIWKDTHPCIINSSMHFNLVTLTKFTTPPN